MHVFALTPHAAHDLGSAALDTLHAPTEGFLWIACQRSELEGQLDALQSLLERVCQSRLLDLHVSDLLNVQLPSHHDFTSTYDLLVFRRLCAPATGHSGSALSALIRTAPVGFAVFDQVLLSVHPEDCSLLELSIQRLVQHRDNTKSGKRLPASPADWMVRTINAMVDGYLALRKELSNTLDQWQHELLNPTSRFQRWPIVLDARMALHQLQDTCEDQRACVQDWIESVKTWPVPSSPVELANLELLQVRSRDVLEHVERVIQHVHRLEQSTETAVQMHFSIQGNRTNDIMRTLTVLTAIFLPLNLIASIFGMNFDFIPLLHQQTGFWWALGGMASCALGLTLFFWRKRYLTRTQPAAGKNSG